MLTEKSKASLFIFAHPDDEFFCLPFIKRDCSKGEKVLCVYLTDGAYGGQSPLRRMHESLAVLGRYGVQSTNVHFEGVQAAIPDGQLHLHAHRAYGRLLQIVKHEFLTNVYVPAWEGGHQDHDTCHVIGVALAEMIKASRPMQFALYNGCSRILPFRVMHPLTQNGPFSTLRVTWLEALQYLKSVCAYPSQWRTWLGLFPFTAWTVLRRRSYVMQSTSVVRLRQRPHEGRLLYEKRGQIEFSEVRDALRELIEHIGARHR